MENHRIPSIRFKGFSDAWEQRKLEEITERLDNLRIPVAESKRVHGNTPYYGAKVFKITLMDLRMMVKIC